MASWHVPHLVSTPPDLPLELLVREADHAGSLVHLLDLRGWIHLDPATLCACAHSPSGLSPVVLWKFSVHAPRRRSRTTHPHTHTRAERAASVCTDHQDGRAHPGCGLVAQPQPSIPSLVLGPPRASNKAYPHAWARPQKHRQLAEQHPGHRKRPARRPAIGLHPVARLHDRRVHPAGMKTFPCALARQLTHRTLGGQRPVRPKPCAHHLRRP